MPTQQPSPETRGATPRAADEESRARAQELAELDGLAREFIESVQAGKEAEALAMLGQMQRMASQSPACADHVDWVGLFVAREVIQKDLGELFAFALQEGLVRLPDPRTAGHSFGDLWAHEAAQKNAGRCLAALMERNPEHARSLNRFQQTPLMLAAMHGAAEALRALLPHSDLDAKEESGENALACSLYGQGNPCFAELLPLVDPSRSEWGGGSLAEHALERRRFDALDLLQEHPRAPADLAGVLAKAKENCAKEGVAWQEAMPRLASREEAKAIARETVKGAASRPAKRKAARL
jgi:hypothetical protein